MQCLAQGPLDCSCKLTYMSDWGFPSTKVVEVEIRSSNTTVLLSKQSSVKIKQFSVSQSPYTEKDVGQRVPPGILPQSQFCILLTHSEEDDCEVRGQSNCCKQDSRLVLLLTSHTAANLDTRIYHETNPLGRLVVTLKKTIVPQNMAQSQQQNDCDVNFHFDQREG